MLLARSFHIHHTFNTCRWKNSHFSNRERRKRPALSLRCSHSKFPFQRHLNAQQTLLAIDRIRYAQYLFISLSLFYILRVTDKRGPMLPVGVMPRICCHPRHSPYIYAYGSHTSLVPDLLYTHKSHQSSLRLALTTGDVLPPHYAALRPMFDSKLCKQRAALQRRQAFRRWPIVASLEGGERSRDSTPCRQLPYTNKSKRDICISTPSYGVRAADSLHGNRVPRPNREYTEPKRGGGGWGVECPSSLLLQPLPAFFHRILQPPKSIYPSAIVSLIYS